MSSCSFMASLLSPTPTIALQHKNDHFRFNTNPASRISQRNFGRHGLCFVTEAKVEGDVLEKQSVTAEDKKDYGLVSLHHVGILCENLERSLDFDQNILGIPYTLSKSGRPAIFFRDPDENALDLQNSDGCHVAAPILFHSDFDNAFRATLYIRAMIENIESVQILMHMNQISHSN